MLRVDRKFLIGKVKAVYRVISEEGNPLQLILKKKMDMKIIDGVISTKKG